VFTDPDVGINVGQAYWQAGGEVGKLEVIDDVTFKVIFAAPNGFFAQQLAWANQDQMTRCPAHYLKQFHKKYNPEADSLAKAAGLETWIAMFQRENGLDQDNVHYANSKRPTLNAWMFTSAPGEDTERAIAVRNPYYFKVDTEGTQLPYFDEVFYQMVADPEVLLLKVLQGEIDMMDQYIATPGRQGVLPPVQPRLCRSLCCSLPMSFTRSPSCSAISSMRSSSASTPASVPQRVTTGARRTPRPRIRWMASMTSSSSLTVSSSALMASPTATASRGTCSASSSTTMSRSVRMPTGTRLPSRSLVTTTEPT
jgi:hypothetical protein